MEETHSFDMVYFFYHYFVEWHPVYFLYQMGKQYDPNDVNTGIWLAVAVLGIAVWFAVGRLVAEVPGRRHGNMFLWWVVFAVFHIWSIPVYIIYDIVVTNTHKKYQAEKQRRYADRTRSEILSGRKDTKFKHIPEDFK